MKALLEMNEEHLQDTSSKKVMMMALLIHNCVLNYVLGPYAGSH
jgi:hypothetical protein